MSVHIVGIDPGLVDTGLVRLQFYPDDRRLDVSPAVAKGIDAPAIKKWVSRPWNEPVVFVEKYRPRHGYGTDMRMVAGQHALYRELPSSVLLNNTGVRKIVTPKMMQMLQVWVFDTSTHHQDLRSAARVALLGMMKDERLNTLLADVVVAGLDGDPWEVNQYATDAV